MGSKKSRKYGSNKKMSQARSPVAKRPVAPAASTGRPAPGPAAKTPLPPPTVRQTHTVESKPNRGTEPSRQAVAEAAYYLWLQRGGSEIENWLAAEVMLRNQASRQRSR